MTLGARPFPALAVEGVDAAQIGVGLDPVVVPETLAWCLRRLAATAPDPGGVELVVTSSLAASALRRVPPAEAEELRTAHQVAHGAGVVAGRTLRLAEGPVVVLLHAGCFRTDLDAEERVAADQLVRRVLVHEAQHVAMHQNRQTYEQPPGVGYRELTLTGGAAAIIEEYRAELGVDPQLRRDDRVWDVREIVEALAGNLDRGAAGYQLHRDAGRLVYEVLTAVLVAWRGLAYVAARDRVLADGAALPAEVTGLVIWREALAPHWDALVRALRRAEPGTAVMTRAALADLVHEVAGILDDAVLDLGFVWTDDLFLIEPALFDRPGFGPALAAARAAATSPLERFRARWRRRPLRGGRVG